MYRCSLGGGACRALSTYWNLHHKLNLYIRSSDKDGGKSNIRPEMENGCHIWQGDTYLPFSVPISSKSFSMSFWVMKYFPPYKLFSTDETMQTLAILSRFPLKDYRRIILIPLDLTFAICQAHWSVPFSFPSNSIGKMKVHFE